MRKRISQLQQHELVDILDWYKEHSNISTCTKFDITNDLLRIILQENTVKEHTKSENIKLTCLEKYGVPNYTMSKAFSNHIKTRDPEEVAKSAEKRKKTNLEKYGVEHALQDPSIKARAEKTCIERYGVRNFALSPELEVRTKATNNARYGVDHPMKLDVFKENYRTTCIEKYGVDNYSRSEQFKSSQKGFCVSRVENEEFKQLFYDAEASRKFLESKEWTIHDLHVYFDVTLSTIEGWIARNDLKDLIRVGRSHYEVDIKNMFPEFVCNTRAVLSNGLELDFYSPEHHLALEFNGTYWHSTMVDIPKTYHLDKSKVAENQGIRLIHIYEYEWNDERIRPIIISMIRLALGYVDRKIYARQCTIREISNKDAKLFNEKNHIQGHRNAEVTYGLFYKEELVQLMSFSRTRYNRNLKTTDDWEIIRGCPGSNNIVVGGVSKLFKYFVAHHNPSSVFSYCDYNKFDGRSYEALGMSFEGMTGPDKTWVFGNKGIKRNPSRYQEYKKTADGIIWGAGSKKYRWTNNKEVYYGK